MKRIGLALSGGGFRASLYHLGLLRFLRDAGILPRVTHITSVSGGSVTAAHFALNWDRYNGSAHEFDAVASELIAFMRMDVRNRIARRFPFAVPLRMLCKLLGRSNRKLTRTGLLEYHYEKYLYGDTSLFELPEKPQLHLLATNLSEGCLCSFNREGLLMVRSQPGHTFRIDHVHVGLATVAMAVTASSAFPAFFPPVELTGADVGANGAFGRQAYTDGGVFDNLGVRMFRFLERPLLADSPLGPDDFVDLGAALEVLRQAGQIEEETPLHRVWQVLMAAGSRPDPLALISAEKAQSSSHALLVAGDGDSEELVVSRLRDAMRRYQFYHDPLFAGLKLADPEAEGLLRISRLGNRILDMTERYWLNRHVLETAFRQATGRACFRRLNSGLDGVLVSDVGKPIKVESNRRAGGVIRTALRASEILMDRVWQLEKERFHDTAGFVFAPITAVVDPVEDATALHPEIQRQMANLRTDIDRFSPLEISSLIQHGYCVCRKACREQPELFGTDLPANAPWDPLPTPRGAAPAHVAGHSRQGHATAPATATLVEARTLQASRLRRIWRTLLDYRDWVSYVYVPIIIPILILLPTFIIRFYEHSRQVNQIVRSLSQGSRDLEQMTRLLETRSIPWKGVAFEDVGKVVESDVKGFEILQDSRIMDLRSWKPGEAAKSDPDSLSFGYRRLKVSKLPDHAADNLFYLNLIANDPKTAVRFPAQQLQPKLIRGNLESPSGGEKQSRWQAVYDFRSVPAGEPVDLIVEYHSHGQYLQQSQYGTVLPIGIRAPTAELTVWILMPTGKEYKSWHIVRYPMGKTQQVEGVRVVTEYLADDFTILAFKLLSLKPDYIYEVEWLYK